MRLGNVIQRERQRDMKKIEITHSRETIGLLTTECPNGFNCRVGSAACFDCKYCDNKKDKRFGEYVICKMENRQLDLFGL